MNENLQRRIVPVSTITIVCFAIMALFQLFVIFGGLEIKASSVKRVAPWAYEPYLRMVGEHPDSLQVQMATKSAPAEKKPSSAMADVAGLLDADPVLPEAPAASGKPETIIPVTTPNQNDAEPVDEDEPVG